MARTAHPALSGIGVHQVCLEAGFSSPGRGACLKLVPVCGGPPQLVNQDKPMSRGGRGGGSSHIRQQCLWAFLEQKFFSHREGHSRHQAPWSPPQPLPTEGASPGTGFCWQSHS